MPSENQDATPKSGEYLGVYRDGMVQMAARTHWPAGTQVMVRVAPIESGHAQAPLGKVIVAGFGLAGRWVADIFDRHGIEYVVVDTNEKTFEAQEKLGRHIVHGDIADADTLHRAGIHEASILVLTVPDEQAVLQATKLARSLKPDLYIVARTNYSSSGMQASQLGADEVIKGEQVIARQFFEMMLRKIGGPKEPKAS